MAYIQELDALTRQFSQQVADRLKQSGLPKGSAYSSYYPGWETQAPQYTVPNAYQMAQESYRGNSLAATCISIRSGAVSEAPAIVQRLEKDGSLTVIRDHPMLTMLQNPYPRVSEADFWAITELNLLISGSAYWEKIRNGFGEVIGLAPMRSDWCSVIRAQQRPIAYVRYQPYGLPYLDIDASEIVIFQYFDPLFPLLKGWSPTMSLSEIIAVDSQVTNMVRALVTNNATLGGIISVAQNLDDIEAERISARWGQRHSGPENAGKVAVFGEGAKFEQTSMTLRDMDFSGLDSRNEARICQRYGVPPIVVAAKVGISATYSNYKEARQSFYEQTITGEWNRLSSTLWEQLLPDYEKNVREYRVNFDTSDVKALQEDRTSQVNRAVTMWEKGLATLNEAREEAGLTALDDGDELKTPAPIPPQLVAPAEPEPAPKKPILEGERDDSELEAATEEIKAFRRFAKTRIKEGKSSQLAAYEFKHLTLDEQTKLLAEFGVVPETELTILAAALNRAADAMAK